MTTFTCSPFLLVSASGGPPPKPLEEFTVNAPSEDLAKKQAIAHLQERGQVVRSMSWGPGPLGKPRLLAYVYDSTGGKKP